MIYFFLGLALLAFVLYGLNGFAKADAAKIAKPLRIVGGLLCLLGALLLSLRGLYIISIPLAGFGLGMLLGKRKYFSQMGGRSRSSSSMSPQEALKVLGLKEGASRDDIIRAHKDKMKENHPDRGGSEEMAKLINQAKDVLLK